MIDPSLDDSCMGAPDDELRESYLCNFLPCSTKSHQSSWYGCQYTVWVSKPEYSVLF